MPKVGYKVRDPNVCTSCGAALEPMPIPNDMVVREIGYSGRVVKRTIPGAMRAPMRWCAPCQTRMNEDAARYQAEDAARVRAWAERLYERVTTLDREGALATLIAERVRIEDEA